MRLTLAVSLIVLISAPAAAFDCKRATTSSEKAICADPAALESDAAMSATFSSVMSLASPSQKVAIAAAQSRWLKDRDNACADSKAAALGACLVQESRQRRRFLAAEPEVGPGAPGRLTPWFRIERGGKRRADIELQLLKFPAPQTPAERAFDTAVEKLAGGLTEPETDDPAADHYAYSRTMRLVYASPSLISAVVEGYQDTGGAHPNSFSSSINIDVAAGRELVFEDLLDSRAAEKVSALCLKSVIAQKKEKMEGDAPTSANDLKDLAKQVTEATGNLSAWSFDAEKATVIYGPYAVGSYAEGGYFCQAPYTTLRPLAKAGFPLP